MFTQKIFNEPLCKYIYNDKLMCFKIYLFIYFWPRWVFAAARGLSLVAATLGATLHCGARASHCGGFSCCGAWALGTRASVVVVRGFGSGVWAQQLWRTGLVAPWHVGSSRTRARTRVPCVGRRILNHCATREAPKLIFLKCGN